MADIISFVKRKPQRPARQRAGAGDIILFPGVRVEYHDQAPVASTPQGKPRTRRRRSKRAVSA